VAPTDCSELLQDGGFEAGGQGWVQYSAQGYELISDFNPRTGLLGAYLAGVNNADDRISQQVALPAEATSITLQAWWYLATAETAGAFDTMTVSLLRPDGTRLADLLTVDNTTQAGIWNLIELDLSPYAGQDIVLQFAARTDAYNISDFYLDDISLTACSAATSPTPAATPSSTATLSPSPTALPTETPVPTATRTATQTITPPGTPTLTPQSPPRRLYLPHIANQGG
jgi:hypothetical protein